MKEAIFYCALHPNYQLWLITITSHMPSLCLFDPLTYITSAPVAILVGSRLILNLYSQDSRSQELVIPTVLLDLPHWVIYILPQTVTKLLSSLGWSRTSSAHLVRLVRKEMCSCTTHIVRHASPVMHTAALYCMPGLNTILFVGFKIR